MNTEQSSAEHFIFRARSRRVARYGKYSGKPATVLFDHADGKDSCDDCAEALKEESK